MDKNHNTIAFAVSPISPACIRPERYALVRVYGPLMVHKYYNITPVLVNENQFYSLSARISWTGPASLQAQCARTKLALLGLFLALA
jgi:hypothetical protein